MHRQGFTLVELLVAMTIFALVSLLSLRALSSTLEHRAHLEDAGRSWRELGRLFAAMEADLANVLSGPAFAFRGDSVASDALGTARMMFARAGGGGTSDDPRPAYLVGYALTGGHVERQRRAGVESDSVVLGAARYPPRLRRLGIRYASSEGDWRDHWDGDTPPRLVELELELENGERITRVLLVR